MDGLNVVADDVEADVFITVSVAERRRSNGFCFNQSELGRPVWEMDADATFPTSDFRYVKLGLIPLQ